MLSMLCLSKFFMFLVLIIIQAINLFDCNDLVKSYRITGGYRPADDRILGKHVVSLRFGKTMKFFGDNHGCSGAIITSQSILTAAHCLYSKSGKPIDSHNVEVVAGTINRLKRSDKTQERKVQKIVRHPYYEFISMENDIAILHMMQELDEDNVTVQRVTLPEKPPMSSMSCTLMGWGRILPRGPYVAELVFANVTILREKTCREKYFMARGHLCAVDEYFSDQDGCQGDSGGPLICGSVLTGLISYNFGCGEPGLPGFYVDVYNYRQWILVNGVMSSEDKIQWLLILLGFVAFI